MNYQYQLLSHMQHYQYIQQVQLSANIYIIHVKHCKTIYLTTKMTIFKILTKEVPLEVGTSRRLALLHLPITIGCIIHLQLQFKNKNYHCCHNKQNQIQLYLLRNWKYQELYQMDN